MDMSFMVLGIFAGLFIGLLVLAIVIRKNNKKESYDERQLFMRNRAFKYSFFTLMGYAGICAILDLAEIYWAVTAVQMFYGVFLSTAVFVTFCVFSDAYFNNSKQDRFFPVVWLILAVGQIVTLTGHITSEDETDALIQNGVLSFPAISIGLAVFFVYVAVISFVKFGVDKLRKDED